MKTKCDRYSFEDDKGDATYPGQLIEDALINSAFFEIDSRGLYYILDDALIYAALDIMSVLWSYRRMIKGSKVRLHSQHPCSTWLQIRPIEYESWGVRSYSVEDV